MHHPSQLRPMRGRLFVRMHHKEDRWSDLIILPTKKHRKVLDGGEGEVVAIGPEGDVFDRDDDDFTHETCDAQVGDVVVFTDHYECAFPSVGRDIRCVRMGDVDAIIER